jgi:hypothetical protein
VAQPSEISNTAVHGHVAALVTHPGYYYLYALYADYPINNDWFRQQETAALLQERLRVIQPLLGLVQPYRKSQALRLFTERRSTERFPPEKVDEAWRQLRELLQRLGAPPGWPDALPPPQPRYAHALPPAPRRRRRRALPPAAREALPVPPEEGAQGPAGAPQAPGRPRRKRKAAFPKSPVDYRQTV